MSIDDLLENAENLSDKKYQPLTAEKLEQYIIDNGAEKVQIYLAAIKDMTKELLLLLYNEHSSGFTPRSHTQILREGTELIHQKHALFAAAENLLNPPKKDSPSPEMD